MPKFNASDSSISDDDLKEIFGDRHPTVIACRRSSSNPPFIKIQPTGSSYKVRFEKHQGAIDRLKRYVPAANRKWSQTERAWFIHPDSIEQACQALEEAFGGRIKRPEPINLKTQVEDRRTIKLEYLGACKPHGSSQESTAYGFANGDWSIEIPESVLQEFFSGISSRQSPGVPLTLYQVLLIEEIADEQTVKSAHRRLARQWHPDVCKEENAAEMFRQINEAYQVLIDPITRKRYNAALHFERSEQARSNERFDDVFSTSFRSKYANYYRAPLRCGSIVVKGQDRVGRFLVSEILSWQDLTNDYGQVAVSTWPAGADRFSILWV